MIAIGGNAILNRTLKAEFERVRPLHADGHVLADGWSLPSGHSSGALVAYGMLAYVLIRLAPGAWRMPAVLLAAAIAFATGCSRVFLQMHYATDVAAGFASGAQRGSRSALAPSRRRGSIAAGGDQAAGDRAARAVYVARVGERTPVGRAVCASPGFRSAQPGLHG